MTTAEITASHERLTRYVHGHFRRKLTLEDARDAAAEALAEIDRAPTPIHEPERWLRRAAWRNALDMIRKIEGEGQTPRERPAGLGDDVDRLPDHHTTDGPLIAAATQDADGAALARALRSLKPDEQRALHLRYADGLDVPAILEILGCNRHQYENLHKRGLKKLREALAAPATTTACREARGLILASTFGGLDHDDAVRRDAHLEACLACRAFTRRQRGLIAALPLPAATTTGVLGRLGALLTGAAPVKVAAVCATCAVATGAGTAVERHELAHRHEPPRAATAERRITPPPPPTVGAASPMTSTSSTVRGRTTRAGHAAKAKSVAGDSVASTASPFLPESAHDPAPTRPATTVPRASTASVKPSSTPKSTSFSGEFTP